jgi:hypothetical protein
VAAKEDRMASNKDPRAEIPGTTTRFKFGQDNRFAIFGPLIALAVLVIIGVYSFSYWSGNRDGTRTGNSIERPAVKPDASPNTPSTR